MIQLIQAVDGKQYEELKKSLHALLTHANQRDWKDYEKYSISDVKRGNIKNCLSTIYYPIAFNFDKDPNWKEKCTCLPWPMNPKDVPIGKNNSSPRKKQSQRNKKEPFELLTLKTFPCLQTFCTLSTFI